MNERYAPGLPSQGVSAELVAAKWALSREELDTYSARSHQLSAKARDQGHFADEIVPVMIGDRTVSSDETIRPSTTVESLAPLKPSFENPEASSRSPGLIGRSRLAIHPRSPMAHRRY
jgi:acetyl-CoA acyltransferase